MSRNAFLTLSVLWLLASGLTLIFISKGDMVLLWNDHHLPILDYYFKYTTWLGDGIMFVPLLVVILLFVSFRKAIDLTYLSLLVLLFAQGLKKTIFKGWPRPTAYFPDTIQWNYVEGVEIAKVNTFPSGHTITAFAIFFFASRLTNNRRVQILFFFAALSAGLSRIYLLQHFLIDVFAGSILGILAGFIALWLGDKTFPDNRFPRLSSDNLIRKR